MLSLEGATATQEQKQSPTKDQKSQKFSQESKQGVAKQLKHQPALKEYRAKKYKLSLKDYQQKLGELSKNVLSVQMKM